LPGPKPPLRLLVALRVQLLEGFAGAGLFRPTCRWDSDFSGGIQTSVAGSRLQWWDPEQPPSPATSDLSAVVSPHKCTHAATSAANFNLKIKDSLNLTKF